MQLRTRNDSLQNEVRSWVMRASHDPTAAMILAERSEHRVGKSQCRSFCPNAGAQGRQRKQTEILDGLLTNADFGLPSTVLPDALPSGQALLGLLDLPGTYSRLRLIGGLREPIVNSKGLLSILAPTTVATRGDLVDSIERQLRRPFG
jgi:hypothetical protein